MRLARKILLPFLLFLCPATASAEAPALKVEEILAKAIERGKFEEKNGLLKEMAWDSRSIDEKLDKNGKLQERTERVNEAVLIQGKVYRRCILINGKPLSAEAQKKEAEREKSFRENAAKPKKVDDDDDDEVELNEALVNRYRFSLVGQEAVNGRLGYVLTFLPRTNVALPENRKMDKLLNRLEGKVWLDAVTFSILKVDMHLTEPTTLFAGLGSVRSLDFLLEFTPVEADVLAPKSIHLRLDGRKLFTALRIRQENHFTNYRKKSELKRLD